MRFISSLLLILLLCFSFGGTALAAQSAVPFVVTPITPTNQDPDIHTYFKLQASPGQRQTVFVKLENLKNEDVLVMIESDNALTSPLGEIQYIPTNGSENAKITDSDFEMRSFISAPSSVLLKSKEKKEVAITLQAPQSDTGTYLGGITFITNLDQTVSEDTKRDPNAYYFDIENRIGFAVAVEWDMPKKQSSTFSIENAGIRLIPAGVQSFIEFRNDNPSILHHFSASYTIKDKNDAELFAGKITNISFAPKTLVRYPIMWKSSSLTDGTYTLVMDADINGKKESHAVHFNVNRDFVEQYISDTGNDLPLTSKTTSSSMLIFLGAGLIATFVLVFFLVSKARHKGKDDA